LDTLDGLHTIFGEVAEGFEVLEKINEALCDEQHRPYKDIRITHTVVLEDPFDDPPGLRAPDGSPELTEDILKVRLRTERLLIVDAINCMAFCYVSRIS
jgi:peptidyl-prolyl cis-trans isomerase-like 4